MSDVLEHKGPMIRWEDMDDSERVMWIVTHVLKRAIHPEETGVPTLDLARECESKLTKEQINQYVTYMNSIIARETYKGKTQEECVSEEVTTQFYWNYCTASAEVRCRVIWHIFSCYAP